MQNNQGRRLRFRLITLTETLITLGVTKNESNNCFINTERQEKCMEVVFLLLY